LASENYSHWVPGLSYSAIFMIQCLPVLVQCWLVMDKWTERYTSEVV